MFSFIFLVFCVEKPLEFKSQAPGLNGYWQKTPPAAALAKDSDTAVNYFRYLKESVKGDEVTTRNITGYGQVTGKTHAGGALLTVTGYKVFVANCTFEKVLESHISALISNYKLLSNKPEVKALTSAFAEKSPNKQPDSGSTSSLPPAPAAKSPNKQPVLGDSSLPPPAPTPKAANKQPDLGNISSPPPAPAPKSLNKQPESGNTNSPSSAPAPKVPVQQATDSAADATNQKKAHAAIDATAAPDDKKNAAKVRFDSALLTASTTADQAWNAALNGFINSKKKPFAVTNPTFI